MPTLIRNHRIVEQPSPPDLLVLEPTDDPRDVVARIGVALPGLKLIAVNFLRYGDGRGYSIARLLRERYGYQGELRAIGVVARDHLQLMVQCGFDSFQLREGEDAEVALAGMDDFSESYQANAAQPVPLFRRRMGR